MSGRVLLRQRSAALPDRMNPYRYLAGLFAEFRDISAVPSAVRSNVLKAEEESERFAALVRLIVLLLIGALLGALMLATGRFYVAVALVYALNLGLSFLAVVGAQHKVYRPWLRRVLTTLDVVVVLAVIKLGPSGRILPGNYTPAITATWALFLLLALTSLRSSAILMVYATCLVAVGLGALLFTDLVRSEAESSLAEHLEVVFRPATNVIRLALLTSAGFVLALAAMRARRTLVRATALARERANLARYFAKAMAGLLAERDLEELRQGRVQPAAVLFADIRGFTALAEEMTPTGVASLLNSFRERASQAIERNGGVVDKFIGDAVMGIFGVPEPGKDDPAAALAAAEDLLASVQRWSAKRVRHGRQPIRVGVGVHYGNVFAGVLGGGRLEFTVIGDAVNVAQRVESRTKELGVDLIASQDTLGDTSSFEERGWRKMPPQTLLGRASLIELYSRVWPQEERRWPR